MARPAANDNVPTAANDNVATRPAANDNVAAAKTAEPVPAPRAPETAAQTPTAAAEPAAPAPIKADELQFHPELSINDAVKGADRATLEAATKDPTVAQQLAEQGGTTQARVERDAAIVLSRDNAGELTAGQVRSSEDFNYEAQVSGHQVETMEHVYRLDGRPPEQIAAEGFAPNPNKEAGTLMEHVAEQVSGSGNYVSTSSEAAHAGTLLNPDFFPSTPIKGADPLSVNSGTTRQTPQDLEYLVREYRISDVDGVKLRDGVGVAAEKEVVIRGANPDQIEYRDITIKQRWEETVDDSEPGEPPWYSYQLTSVRKISTSDVNVGEWQSLPKVENAAKPISDPPSVRRASDSAQADKPIPDGAQAGKPVVEVDGKTSANDAAAEGGGTTPTATRTSECTTCGGSTAAKPDPVAATEAAPTAQGSAWRDPDPVGPAPTSTTTDTGTTKPLFKPLFAKGGAKMTDVAQGQLGDCYLMSALGAVAKTRPELLERMIVDNGDGTSTMSFESGARTDFDSQGNPITVPGQQSSVTVANKVPTDATPNEPPSFFNRALNTLKGQSEKNDPFYGAENKYAGERDASWVSVAEKAYAEEFGGGTGYEGIGAGGHPSDVWKNMGFTDTRFNWNNTLSESEVATKISDLTANNQPVVASTPKVMPANGPPGGHAYVVEGTSTAPDGTTMVDVFNPWNGTSGFEGKFQATVPQFQSWFQGFYTGVPPK